ncbi:MAG: winged helix-turn-helix domain-containing protein [Acidimicrobiales bacterium]
MGRPEDLSSRQARALAVVAQGLARPPAGGPVGRTRLGGALERLALVQIDSVSALVRSHYLPAFSRLGPYDRDLLDAEAYRHRRLFEYWGHEASLVRVEHQPLLRWRMAAGPTWRRMRRIVDERPELLDKLEAAVAAGGPVSAGELAGRGLRRGPWWGWDEAKTALEALFWMGRVCVAERRGFERRYDLPERVIPAAVLGAPTPPVDEAHRRLLALAARSLGVATAADLADYWRMPTAACRPRIAELAESAELVPVRVEGWEQPAWRHASSAGGRPRGAALLSPFDPVVWSRPRAERLWGFRYRLEIYTPAHRRVHGYYVLPFLLGDRLVARVDLRSDRQAGALAVHAAHAEEHADAAAVAPALAAELRSMAAWLGLAGVEVADRGGLAPALSATLHQCA